MIAKFGCCGAYIDLGHAEKCTENQSSLDPISRACVDDAAALIRKVMTEGFKRYPEQRRLARPVNVHLKHVLAHVAYSWQDEDTSIRYEDFENALCRLAMAVFVRDHDVWPNTAREGIDVPFGTKVSPNWIAVRKV